MRLTILGTGNASVKTCFNTCFVFSNEGQHFLVDTGGGNRILKELERAGIPLEEIHDVFITHKHLDHVLGVLWLIRCIGMKVEAGEYEGSLSIYCHGELLEQIYTMANMTIDQKILNHIGREILFVELDHGDQLKLLDSDLTFFDIFSTKAKQYGFTMVTRDGIKIGCCGDEPFNPKNREFLKDCDYLMHEAFCLSSEAELFKPYEKHHSTVREACENAAGLGVENLILYHTEETHLEERKRLYTEEGSKYYQGRLFVPDDGEVFEIQRTLKFPGHR